MRSFNIGGIVLLATSCSAVGEGERIEVTEANDLGVVAIEVVRFDDQGARVVALRGVDASENTVASVIRRTGVVISDAARDPGDDDIGSEVTISAGTDSLTIVAHQLERFRVHPLSGRARQFVDLTPMRQALDQESIVVDRPPNTAGEVAFTWLHSSWPCDPNDLLRSPVAAQCCETYSWDSANPGSNNDDVAFINPAGQEVDRYRNPDRGLPCARDDHQPCSGTACTYGPLGFTVAYLYTSSGNPWMYTAPNGQCLVDWIPDSGTPPHEYADKVGNWSTRLGCGAGSGGPGFWDY